MVEQTPKTLECCGRKPRRKLFQTGYRDEVNVVVLECRVCKNRISEDDDSVGEYQMVLNATKKWNKLVGGKNGISK